MLKRTRLSKSRLATVLGMGLVVLGCSSDKAPKEEPATTETEPAPVVVGNTNVAPPGIAAPAPDPIDAPKDVYGGNARVVHFAWKDGAPIPAVDVWATKSALYKPVKVVENLAYGEASRWFQSPKGSPIRVFAAGAEATPDNALTGVAYARKGTDVTGILLNRENGTVKTNNTWDASTNPEELQTPDAPPEGKGYVLLRADQLRLHEEAMADVTGGRPLRVGDGKKSCLFQRVEDMGHQPSLLGGTQPVRVDLTPGKKTISFHKGDSEGCAKADKVYEVNLDIVAGEAQTVMLYTSDAKSVKHIVLPTPVNTAKPYGANKVLRAAKAAERAQRKAKKDAERAEKAAKQAAEDAAK